MKYLIPFFLFIASALSFDGLKHQADNKIEVEFKNLSAALSETKNLKADFTQSKKIKVLKRPLISSGILIFDRSAGVYWKLEKPFESTIIIDRDKLISVNDEGDKVVIKAEDKPMLYGFTKIFMSVFSSNTEELKKHFEIYYGNDNKKWKIGLIPKSGELKKVIAKILMTGSDKKVEEITLWETNGDITKIKFSNIKKSEKLTKEDKKKFEL